jgi:hypothetical protein
MKTVITDYDVLLARTSDTEHLRIISSTALAFGAEDRLCTCLDREGLHVVEPGVGLEVVFAPGLGMEAQSLFAVSCADRRAVHVEEARADGRRARRLLVVPCCHDPAHCPRRPGVFRYDGVHDSAEESFYPSRLARIGAQGAD